VTKLHRKLRNDRMSSCRTIVKNL